MERDEKRQAERATRIYERELADLDRQVSDYYSRYGTDNVLRYRDLLQTMDAADRDLLMRDVDRFAALHPEHADLVEIRKSIYKLDRLEGLQASARLHMAQATADATDGLDEHFESNARKQADAVAKALGHGDSFSIYDDAAIRGFVNVPWSSGQSYSQKVWGNTQALSDMVNDEMAKAFARGDSYASIRETLHHRFVDVPVSSLTRLVYTEGTYVARQVQGDEFKREGFESYYLETVGDSRVCDECRSIASETQSNPVSFDNESPGINYPPIHPRCRCQVNPAVDDWQAWAFAQIDSKRAEIAARHFSE